MPRIYVYKIKRTDKMLLRAMAKAGGLSGLAKRLGVSRQAVQKWDSIPDTRLLAIRRIANG